MAGSFFSLCFLFNTYFFLSEGLNARLKADNVVVRMDLWCVAKNNAEDNVLQAALDWACGQGGVDCRQIQQGGPCFEPSDIQSHASYAFNDYYLRNGVTQQSCDFGSTAALTALNPSHGNCIFPSSSSARNGSFTGSTAPTTVIEPSWQTDTNDNAAKTIHGGYIILTILSLAMVFLTRL